MVQELIFFNQPGFSSMFLFYSSSCVRGCPFIHNWVITQIYCRSRNSPKIFKFVVCGMLKCWILFDGCLSAVWVLYLTVISFTKLNVGRAKATANYSNYGGYFKLRLKIVIIEEIVVLIAITRGYFTDLWESGDFSWMVCWWRDIDITVCFWYSQGK